MPSNVFDILQWAKEKGEVQAINRIQMKVLSETLTEGIQFRNIDRNTKCSPTYVRSLKKAASEVVGEECPIAID